MSKFQATIARILIRAYLGFKEVKMIEIDGKYYLYRTKNPNYISDFGMCVAVIRCIKIFSLYIPVIITDNWFDDITKNDVEMKEFIIRHEIGHYELKHFELNLNNLSIEEKINLEVEADRYAANYVGDNIALKSIEYLEIYLNEKFNAYDKSFERRKNSIKGKIETA